MNSKEFNDIINKQVLTEDELKKMEELVIRFPFFAVPHIIVAKEYIKNKNPFSELKVRSAAVHTTNRRHLKEFIHTEYKEIVSDISVSKNIIPIEEIKKEEVISPVLEEIKEPVQEQFTHDTLELTSNVVEPEIIEAASLTETPLEITTDSAEPIEVISQAQVELNQPEIPEIINITEEITVPDIAPVLPEIETSTEETEVEKNEINRIETNQTEEITAEIISTEEVEVVISPSNQHIYLSEEDLFRQNLAKHLADLKKEREKLDLYIAEQTQKKLEEKTKKKDVEKSVLPELKLEIPILEIPKRSKKKSDPEEEDQEKTTGEKPTKKDGYFINKKNENTNFQPDSDGTDFILDYLDLVNKERKQLFRDKKSTEKLIDEFIKNDPKIKKASLSDPVESVHLPDVSVKENNLATENLAKIYIKQNNFPKAITIYEQLILKYPEKKVYFADQIEKLKST